MQPQPTQLLSEFETSIRGQYISSKDLLRVVLLSRRSEQYARVTRAWISQGIPFGYQDCPLAFEVLRDWVAGRFDIEPRDVTVIGSVRLGYSASMDTFGSALRSGNEQSSSDIDLAIISEQVYSECSNAFGQWKSDVDKGNATAVDQFQSDSLVRLPKNIQNGFIDPYKVPRRYGKIQPILYRMSELGKLLNRGGIFPATRKVSLRVYKNWRSFDQQMERNIQSLKKIAAARMTELNS